VINQSDQTKGSERLQRSSNASEATNENETCCHIDDDANHDKKVNEVPDAPQVSVWGEEKSISNNFDHELHEEYKAKHRLGNIKPRPSNQTMSCIVMAAVKWSSDTFNGDPANDSQEYSHLEDGKRDWRVRLAENALTLWRLHYPLAQLADPVLLRYNPKYFVICGVIADKIGSQGSSLIIFILSVFTQAGVWIHGREKFTEKKSQELSRHSTSECTHRCLSISSS